MSINPSSYKCNDNLLGRCAWCCSYIMRGDQCKRLRLKNNDIVLFCSDSHKQLFKQFTQIKLEASNDTINASI